MLRFASLLIAATTLVAGCASTPPGATPPRSGPSAGGVFGGLFGSGLSPALDAQRTRLKQALDGTPVVIEATGDRRLRVEVPTRHAFEPGRAAIKPALAAVLDQFAIGFRPYAASTELRVGAPDNDPNIDAVCWALVEKDVRNLKINHVTFTKITRDEKITLRDIGQEFRLEPEPGDQDRSRKMLYDMLFETALSDELRQSLDVAGLLENPSAVSRDMIRARYATLPG